MHEGGDHGPVILGHSGILNAIRHDFSTPHLRKEQFPEIRHHAPDTQQARRHAMNPMRSNPMHLDRMIFEFNASVFATSLYILICSHLDEGERPTLNHARRAWNGTAESLIQAARELIELRVMQPLDDPFDLNKPLYLNPREKWAWCKRAMPAS